MTANDERVLENIKHAMGEYDGYAPHGAADWVAIKRLKQAGLIACVGDGWCETCPQGHDAPLYAPVQEPEAARPTGGVP